MLKGKGDYTPRRQAKPNLGRAAYLPLAFAFPPKAFGHWGMLGVLRPLQPLYHKWLLPYLSPTSPMALANGL